MQFTRKRLVWGTLAVLSVTAFAFLYRVWASASEPSSAVLRMHRAANPWNRQLIDSGVGLLRSGDLVLRTGADVTSYMFTQMNQKEKTYSHCGIVVVENGYPFIYHCIGGEDNPDERLRRDSAGFWFSPANNLGFGIVRYDLDSSQTARLLGIVKQYYREGRRFDMSFDLDTDERLYCAELVYKAVNSATENNRYIEPVTAFGHTFVAVDNLFLNPHARFICQHRYK